MVILLMIELMTAAGDVAEGAHAAVMARRRSGRAASFRVDREVSVNKPSRASVVRS